MLGVYSQKCKYMFAKRHAQECSWQPLIAAPNWKQSECLLTMINISKYTQEWEPRKLLLHVQNMDDFINIILGRIRHKSIHTVRFYLYNVQHQAKPSYAARGKIKVISEGVVIRSWHKRSF